MKAAYLLDTLGVYSIVQVLDPHGRVITVRSLGIYLANIEIEYFCSKENYIQEILETY